MIFQHTFQAVIEGRKTATRRLVNPSDRFTKALAVVAIGKNAGSVIQTVPTPKNALLNGSCVHAVWSGKRVKWQVGKEYAVQPSRTSKGIARIRLLSLRQEDVRHISREDVAAEGFPNRYEFFLPWLNMHDRRAVHSFIEDTDFVHYTIDNFLAGRPAERYQAWVLCFELVKD